MITESIAGEALARMIVKQPNANLVYRMLHWWVATEHSWRGLERRLAEFLDSVEF